MSIGEKDQLGRQFSEGCTYLAAWLVAVAVVCSVVGLVQPREGGGGIRVVCGGWRKQKWRRRQRMYLEAGEAGGTGWRWRLVLCGGGGSRRVAAAAAQNVSGTGHQGHITGSGVGIRKLRWEAQRRRGPGARGPDARAGSDWQKGKECSDG
jgi:hypothetical protein